MFCKWVLEREVEDFYTKGYITLNCSSRMQVAHEQLTLCCCGCSLKGAVQKYELPGVYQRTCKICAFVRLSHFSVVILNDIVWKYCDRSCHHSELKTCFLNLLCSVPTLSAFCPNHFFSPVPFVMLGQDRVGNRQPFKTGDACIHAV